jgi:hypothetical protein
MRRAMDAKKIKKLSDLAAPKKLGAYLSRKKMAMTQRAQHGGRKAGAESIRQLVHDGHKIVIHTTYRFEVDGKLIKLPLGVDDSGQVHCHSLPNYQTTSAVDMVKALIDNFPDDFIQRRTRPKPRITSKRLQKKR